MILSSIIAFLRLIHDYYLDLIMSKMLTIYVCWLPEYHISVCMIVTDLIYIYIYICILVYIYIYIYIYIYPSEMTWGCTLVCYPWSNAWGQYPRLPFSLESGYLGKIQGLADEKTHKSICRHLFCLPFLPAEQIQPIFATILALDTLTFPIPHSLRQLLD